MTPQMDQAGEPCQHLGVRALVNLVPVQLRALESLTLLRIGNLLRVPPKRRELPIATFRDRLPHLAILVVGEILKRS